MKVANSDMSVARGTRTISHIVNNDAREKYLLVKLWLTRLCGRAEVRTVKYPFSRASWQFPRFAGVGRAWPDPRSTRSHRGRSGLASIGLRRRSAGQKRQLPGSPACSRVARAPAWRCDLAS